MSRNDVFVQRGIRTVKLWQLSVGAFLRINTVVILIGDVIRGNRWVVQAEMEGCKVWNKFVGAWGMKSSRIFTELLSMEGKCAAASLFFAWVVVPMFPRRMSLFEVRISCRFVSSSMLQCYPWRCRGAWRMLSIQPWFFFESPCLGFYLWCCMSVPDIYVGFNVLDLGVVDIYTSVSVSVITFVCDLFIFRPWLSLSSASFCSICCSSCGVLAHISMSSAKRRWLRYSPSIFKALVS